MRKRGTSKIHREGIMAMKYKQLYKQTIGQPGKVQNTT